MSPPGAPDAAADLTAAGAALADAVARALPGWLEAAAGAVLDAWGGGAAPYDRDVEADVQAELRLAAAAATQRVVAALAVLAEQPAGEQATTPGAIVASAFREPAAVLDRLGVPEVVVAGRREPGDRYGLSPASPADLGPEVGARHRRWGQAKFVALAAAGRLPGRRTRRSPGDSPAGKE